MPRLRVVHAHGKAVMSTDLAEQRRHHAEGDPHVAGRWLSDLVLGAQDKGYIGRTGLADREIVQVRLGDTALVRLDALPDATLNGKVTEVASASDAASTIVSVIFVAPERIVPKPTPGKMKALLPCPIGKCLSPRTTGSNGLPVAMSAFPSVHSRMSAGSASHELVGFESGKMIGCSVFFAAARIVSSVNAPG